jgi:hypothetical protein
VEIVHVEVQTDVIQIVHLTTSGGSESSE